MIFFSSFIRSFVRSFVRSNRFFCWTKEIEFHYYYYDDFYEWRNNKNKVYITYTIWMFCIFIFLAFTSVNRERERGGEAFGFFGDETTIDMLFLFLVCFSFDLWCTHHSIISTYESLRIKIASSKNPKAIIRPLICFIALSRTGISLVDINGSFRTFCSSESKPVGWFWVLSNHI